MTERSIVGTVLRAQAASIALAALAIVGVGSVAAGLIVVRRDDDSALALGRTLGQEIEAHASEPATTPEP